MFPRSERGRGGKHVRERDAAVCSTSQLEALRNFDTNVLAEMRKVDIKRLSPSISPRSGLSTKKVSHVSTGSFLLNKNGLNWKQKVHPTVTVDFRCKTPRFHINDNFIGALSRGILANNFSYDVQVRGFNTERSVRADLKRNPNIVNRLRKFMGQYIYYFFLVLPTLI